jgi:peptide/nickel transport system substrate-binding protein
VRADYIQSATINLATYNTLITYDKQGQIVGSLATEFSYGEDAQSITFKLRDGVKFHDGTPLTANDVVYTLDRIKSLGVGVAGMVSHYQTAEVIDDQTVRVGLTEPDTLFIGALSDVFIINSALVEDNAGSDQGQAWLLNHDAGSGPYEVTDFEPNSVELTRFDDYWDFDDSRPTMIVEKRIDEQATQRDELLSGSIDVAGWIDPADVDQLTQAGMTAVQGDSLDMAYIYMNNSYGATADLAVRQAIRLAYDYQGGLAQFRSGNGVIATGVAPASMACRPDIPASRQDLDEAKRLLAEAGYENLELTMRFQPAFPEQAQEATLLQSNLAEIGVTLNLEPIAFPDYLTMLQDWPQIPELMLATATLSYPDPGGMLLQSFYSNSIGTNRNAYKSAEVDELIDQSLTEPDPDARCALFVQAQERIEADAVQVNMYSNTAPLMHRPGLTGVDHSPVLGMVTLGDIKLASR